MFVAQENFLPTILLINIYRERKEDIEKLKKIETFGGDRKLRNDLITSLNNLVIILHSGVKNKTIEKILGKLSLAFYVP